MDFFKNLFGFAKEQLKSTASTPVTVIRKIFRKFVTGAFFLLPLAITVILITWLGTLVVEYLGPNTYVGSCLKSLGFIYTQADKTEDYTLLAYVVGWLVILGFILVLGSFIEMVSRQWAVKFFNQIAKTMKKCTVDLFERGMNSIPAVGMVYKSSRQLVNMVDQGDAEGMKNMTPVYCRFGSTIILALVASADKFIIKDKKYYAVIIPTAPVPFGGAVIMVPEEDVWDADMKFEELLSFYGSMGVTGSEFIKTEKNSKTEEVANEKAAEKITADSGTQAKTGK